MINFQELIEAFKKETFNGLLYHGTGTKFDKFDQRKSRIANDLWGGGVAYFTDNLSVAITYARSMAKTAKTDTPFVYFVNVKLKNIFDVDTVFTGEDLVKILPKKTTEMREFARGAGLMTLNADEGKVLYGLEKGKLSLTGAEIFRGYSKGMNQTAKVREMLIGMGYDGLRYNGGEQMDTATKHNVYLAYDAKNLIIAEKRVPKK